MGAPAGKPNVPCPLSLYAHGVLLKRFSNTKADCASEHTPRHQWNRLVVLSEGF